MNRQTWDPEQYARQGRFVADLAGGVFDLLAPQPGERILDLGCGDGALAQRIADAGALVIGIDSSPQMVEAARNRGLDARVTDAAAIPFEREFHAVFSNAALHWMRDQTAVLSGIHRALLPGGRFVAELGGHGNIASVRVALAAVLQRHSLHTAAIEDNYFFTPGRYRAMLESEGFAVDRIELLPRPTPLPESGMRGWLETFRRGLLDRLPAAMRERFIDDVVALLKPELCDEQGCWTADYVRLRFRAHLPRP